MKFMIYLLILGCASASVLPVNPGGIGGLFKGPNSETIIKGPDGSVITSAVEGGEVHTKSVDLQPIVVAENIDPLPAVLPTKIEAIQTVPVNIPSSPIISSVPLAPVQSKVVHEDPHVIETELVDAPDVEPDQASDLIGPSGTISTRGSKSIVSGPASTTISEPVKKIPLIPLVPIASPILQPVPIIDSSPILVNQPLVHQPQLLEAQKEVHLPVVDNLATNGVISNSDLIASSTPVVSSTLAPVQLAENAGISISSTANPIQVISSTTPKPAIIPSTIQPPVLTDLQLQQILSQQSALNNQQVLNNPVLIAKNPNLVNINPSVLNLQQKGLAIDSSSILSNGNLQKLPTVSSTSFPDTISGISGKIDLNQAQLSAIPVTENQVIIPNQGLENQVLSNQVLANGQQRILLNSNSNQLYLQPAKTNNEVALLRDTNPIQFTGSNAQVANLNAESAQLTIGSRLVGEDPISRAVWNRYGRQTLKYNKS